MNKILYPFILIIENLYNFLYTSTNNFGTSLILLSIITSILMFSLKSFFKKFPEREIQIQAVLQPQIDKINKETTGVEKHQRISNLYKRYSYHPILALRAAIPIFIQLPFLFAAYYILNNYEAFKGISFLGIKDLSRPDLLLSHSGIISFSISLLPVLMTTINICSAFLIPKINKKSRNQSIVIALFLFVLLYKSSSALLIYWTVNNIIFALGAIYLRLNYNKSINYNYQNTLSIKYNYNKVINFISKKKVRGLLRIYFALLVLYVIFSIELTGMSLILMPSNLYFFLFITISFLILSAITVIENHTSKQTITTLIYLLVLILPLIIMFCLKNYYYDRTIYLKYYLYVTAWVYFFTGLISSKHKSINSVKNINYKSAISVVFMFSLSPAIYLARMNPDYLSGVFYLIFFAIFAIFALIVYSFVRYIANGQFLNIRVAMIASLFAFLLTSLPIIRAYYAGNNTNFIDFSLILLATFFLTIKIKTKKQFNVVRIFGLSLIIVLSISLIFIPSETLNKSIEVSSNNKLEISFSGSNSIYLLVYDGSMNERTYDILNIETNTIKSLFTKFGFKWYKDTYSLGSTSLESMGGVLSISNANLFSSSHLRDIYAGNSKVNRVFNSNGYKTYKILNNYLTGSINDNTRKLVEEYYPSKEKKIISELDFFIVLLRGIFQGELKFDTEGIVGDHTIERIQAKKRELTLKDGEKKFVVNHINFPGHTGNSGSINEREKRRWMERLKMSYKLMQEDFENITKNDPQAIIIAIGDHGPQLTGDGTGLKNWNREDITTDLIWDRIGTMIAIRWPDKEKASKFDQNLVLNQDIFPVLFSYLSDDDQYLSLKPDRTFKGFKIIFKEGHLINNIL